MSKKDKQSSTSLPVDNTFFYIIKQTFEVKKRPFPWPKAINAGICGGFPIIFGLLINRLDLGLLGGMGTFAYLYNFNEPYAVRAKKIFFAALGLSCAVGLGTLVCTISITFCYNSRFNYDNSNFYIWYT